MRQHRSENDLHLGQRFIAESEQRILRQRQMVERMRRKGQPTEQAEAVLKGFEASLLQLRNHVDVMQELMKPDEYAAKPNGSDEGPQQ
jgi:hypothetical protein